jgi:hypothetical protein
MSDPVSNLSPFAEEYVPLRLQQQQQQQQQVFHVPATPADLQSFVDLATSTAKIYGALPTPSTSQHSKSLQNAVKRFDELTSNVFLSGFVSGDPFEVVSYKKPRTNRRRSFEAFMLRQKKEKRKLKHEHHLHLELHQLQLQLHL